MSNHPTYLGPASVAEVAILGHVGSNVIANVLHFQRPGGTGGTDDAWLDAVLADLNTNLKVGFLASKPGDYGLDVWRGKVIAQPGLSHVSLATHDLAATGTVTGAIAGSATYLSDAACVRLRTALAGRKYRGRIMLGPLGAGTVVDGAFATGSAPYTGVVTFNTALQRYIGSGASTGTALLCVWSNALHVGEQQWTVRVNHVLTVKSNTAASAGFPTLVTSTSIDTVVRSVRRREAGVGA
jgi:hypothetical protein